MPSASLGADAVLLGVMRWAMASWERVNFLNRYAGGTVMPRLVMDFLPGLFCSAHFALSDRESHEAPPTESRPEVPFSDFGSLRLN